MTILYFTATGNSLHVAKSLGGDLLSIPQMMKEERYEFTDDKIGVVFPVYEWSVCAYVADFLKKASFHTGYLFAIATYGIFAGGVGSHVMNLGEAGGNQFAYVNKIKMVDSYLPGFKMKQQMASEYKKDIDGQIAKIKADIDDGKAWRMPESAMRQKMTSFMVGREAKKDHSGIQKIVSVNDSCIQCGVCTKVCSVNNISLRDEKVIYGKNCFSCYACIQNCPSNAIHIKSERDSSRFRNTHVSLQEIITSNE